LVAVKFVTLEKEIPMLRKLIVIMAALATLLILPGLAAAQAPAAPPAPQAAPAPEHPQAQAQPPCQMGPGGTCIMPGKMTPEQMKQMQGKMGQCCMMQPGQGSPMCQQMQKQIDDLQKRVEALEGKKQGKKK
jgi:uncharacterized membrane protein